MIAEPLNVPLRTDKFGIIRVGETQVLLELVIHAFQRGETAEGIIDSYPTLKLSDVYTVRAYYLNNRKEVETYLERADTAVERLQHDVESDQPGEATALRAKLRTRRSE